MIEINEYILEPVKPKHYPFILSLYKMQATVKGYINPSFHFHNLETIQEKFDNQSNSCFYFVVSNPKSFALGIITLVVEWEKRNGVVSLIMNSGNNNRFGDGFRLLNNLVKFCKEELNLRRLEMKISEENKTMMKTFRIFPKDKAFILEVLEGKKDWHSEIRDHYDIDVFEFNKNEKYFVYRYITDVLFNKPVSDLVLRDDSYYEGRFYNFHLNSILLDEVYPYIDELMSFSAGGFLKRDIAEGK